MGSDIASSDKIERLRAFAGRNVPTSRLRSALFRAGGDIDTAALQLLTNSATNPSEPILIPQPEQPKPVSNPKPVIPEKDQEKEKRVKKNTKSELRRKAWIIFYHEKYPEAVVNVGNEKTLIDQYIVDKWKAMGSKNRDEYTTRVVTQAEETDKQKQGEQISQQNGKDEEQNNQNDVLLEHSDNKVLNKSEPVSVDEDHIQEQPQQVDEITIVDEVKATPKKPSPLKRKRPRTPVETTLPENNLDQDDPSINWPRKIASRLCRGSMLTTGKKILTMGDELTLEAPSNSGLKLGSNRGKNRKSKTASNGLSRIVRFSKSGRELGRLAPDISHALAPALQSGFIQVTCTVVQAPPVVRMFSEVYLDLSLHILKEAFEGEREQQLVERGDDSEKPVAEQGIDTSRINVVHLITSLKICEPAQKRVPDFQPLKNTEDGEVGAVTEEGAEAYYRSVDSIDEKAAMDFNAPRNLSCTLRDYQSVGVGWMVAREKYGSQAQLADPTASEFLINPLWKKRNFPDGGCFFINPTTGGLSLRPPVANAGGPYGGILADEMGLGKTVQCIACIVKDMEEQIEMKNSNGETEVQEFSEEDSQNPKVLGDSPFEDDKRLDDDDDDHDVKNARSPHRQRKFSRADSCLSNQNSCSNGKTEDSVDDDDKILKEDNPRKDNSLKTNSEENELQTKQESEDDDDDDFVDDNDEKDEDYNPYNSQSPASRKRAPPKRTPNGSGKRRRVSSVGKESAFKVLMSKKQSNLTGGTLIVCPTSLVTQWMNELNLHVKPRFLRIMTHYGQGRGDTSSISIINADVVVTTYGILASESSDEKDGTVIGHSGPLLQMKWRRVILDEAHTIKSRTTTWARAAYQLQAERRWCVTGTVIHNHINDVFSLLHFLEVKPWSSWAFWNRGIVSNMESKDVSSQTAAMSLVRDIISSITLRRKKTTKDSTGKCIVQLTKKNVEIVSLEPSPEERDFYTALHQRTKTQFDTFLAQGKVMKNFASVLELLLRLRQACDHPYLVFAAAPSKDSVVMKDKDKLFKQFLQAGSSSQYIEKVLKDADKGALDQSTQCPVCLDVLDDAVAPRECGHPACRLCLHETIERTRKCPVCRTETTVESITTLPRASRFSVNLDQKWRSSAKIDAMLEEVKERQARRIQGKKAIGKTVVFSQFTSMLDLVGFALDREKLNTLRIDGSVPQSQRGTILEQFANEKETTPGAANILLVSLRAGGVGLNLVTASHAILLDIHWNPQVDAQAQDRIHRHGQTRDVTIRRYIIKDTVEEKLLKVQDRKQNIADGALDVATEEDKKQARLSELKLLFSSG